MIENTTLNLRNLALLGQSGAGKTTLAERLLTAAGMLTEPGSVAAGTTTADFDPQEQAAGHSLDLALLHLEHDGVRACLIDTPGLPDLLGRPLAALAAVETAAVVMDARHGVEPVAERLLKAAERQGQDRLIIINKIDAADADPAALLDEIQQLIGPQCLPLNLPAEGGRGVVDCFFRPAYDAAVDLSSVEAAHDAMIDQVVELDEALMEVYLEQGKALNPDQLHEPFEQALREGHLIPVCFVSAASGAGIDLLLETLVRLLPNPTEGNPPPFVKGETAPVPVSVTPRSDGHALCHVFKISNDPFRGKLAYVRVHQGRVRPNAQLFIGDARKPCKLQHLYRVQGAELSEIDEALPGDIIALARIDALHVDAVLHDSHDEDHHHLQHQSCPAAVHSVGVTPAETGEEQKLGAALHKLLDEDPCLQLRQSRGETLLSGLGRSHVEIALARMLRLYKVAVTTHPPSVPYRETLTRAAEGHHRHKKQTGGAGQFGEVFLRVEPLPPGSGFEFVDAITGGVVPGQFIPAVEKGVREALEEGPVAGFPVQDVRVTLYDGKTHSVDSKEVAFVAAGKRAFQEAAALAGAVILEPVAGLQVRATTEDMGAIAGDLSSRRGRILDTEHLANERIRLHAEVPLAELLDYETVLKSLTGGRAHHSLELHGYEPVPGDIQRRLADAHSPG